MTQMLMYSEEANWQSDPCYVYRMSSEHANKLGPFDSFINNTKDTPDYQLNINCLNISSLLISQNSNHVSPCKLGLMQNDWVRKVNRTVIKLCYENHVKFPRRHLVRVQGKLKITKQEKIYISKFLKYFSIFQCTRYQTSSVGDVGRSLNHEKPLYHRV